MKIKTKTKKLFKLLAVPAILLAPGLPAFAAPPPAPVANLYLSPASANVTPGGSLTVEVHENSGSDPVNLVKATLNYPESLLDFITIDSSPAFGFNIKNSGGGGTVQLIRGAHPAVAGDQVVATIKFQSRDSIGTAAINFTSDTQVWDNNNIIITGAMTGGNYAITAPVAPVSQPTPQAAPVKTPVKAPAVIPAPVQNSAPAVQSQQSDLTANFNVQPAAAGSPAPSRWPLIIPAVLAAALLVYHGPRRRTPKI
jgi:hypothetical protein